MGCNLGSDILKCFLGNFYVEELYRDKGFYRELVGSYGWDCDFVL